MEEDNVGLVRPAQALIKSRSESMLSMPSTSFSIPRKPVPSRTVSMDQIRSGPCHDINLESRPSIAARQSTRDFLDALDARLPQSPPALQYKPGPEPVYTLYRRASEQSLRLRIHLEERRRIESLLPECDTIEEKIGYKSKGLSPILDRDETTPVDDPTSHCIQTSVSPSPASKRLSHRSSKDVSTPAKPFRRSIVSEWLIRSVGSQTSLISDHSSLNTKDDCAGHQQCTFRDRSSTSSTVCSSSTLADLQTTCTTPHPSPHKKNNSIPTVPFPRMDYELEKKPVEMAPVGVTASFLGLPLVH